MKRLMFPALALSLVAATGFAQDNVPAVKENADENIFYAKAALDFYSGYVWRGQVINDEPVWQPNAELGVNVKDYGKLGVGFWSNFDATKRNRQTAFGGLNQINYTAGYQTELRDFSFAAGHIWFTFPKANGPDYGGSAREIYASLAYNNEYVVPFIEGYWDYSVAEGVYAIVGLRKEFTLDDRLKAGAEVSLGDGSDGYTKAHFGGHASKTSLMDGNAALFAKYDLTDNLYIGARLAWMSLLDGRIKDVHHKDNTLWGGLTLGAAF